MRNAQELFEQAVQEELMGIETEVRKSIQLGNPINMSALLQPFVKKFNPATQMIAWEKLMRLCAFKEVKKDLKGVESIIGILAKAEGWNINLVASSTYGEMSTVLQLAMQENILSYGTPEYVIQLLEILCKAGAEPNTRFTYHTILQVPKEGTVGEWLMDRVNNKRYQAAPGKLTRLKRILKIDQQHHIEHKSDESSSSSSSDYHQPPSEAKSAAPVASASSSAVSTHELVRELSNLLGQRISLYNILSQIPDNSIFTPPNKLPILQQIESLDSRIEQIAGELKSLDSALADSLDFSGLLEMQSFGNFLKSVR